MGFWDSLETVLKSPAGATGLNIGTDFITSFMKSRAATGAAKTQTESATKSNALIDESLARSKETLSPFINTGVKATSQLTDLMNPQSETYASYFGGEPKSFTAPDPADVLNNPAIQFQLEQGNKAIERSAAARGGLVSGATAKQLTRYSQGVAAQGYNDVYNRAIQEYGLARNAYETNRATRLDLLNKSLQSGQSAATTYAGLDTALSGLKGENLQGAANVTAAGDVASGDIWSDLAGNTVGNLFDLATGKVNPIIQALNTANPIIQAIKSATSPQQLADIARVIQGNKVPTVQAPIPDTLPGSTIGEVAALGGAGAAVAGTLGAGAGAAAPAAAGAGAAGAGGAGAGAGAGAGGGGLVGLLTNPAFMLGAAAIPGVIAWKSSQVHPWADKLGSPEGPEGQWAADMRSIHEFGTANNWTREQKLAALTESLKEHAEQGVDWAKQNNKAKKVVQQWFEGFYDPNWQRDWPELAAVVEPYRSKVGLKHPGLK